MSDDFSPELRRELLDDFYAECDELLTAIRSGLAQLEARAGQGKPEAATIEALFRGTHSLKGIAAIVGLRPAEQLAHGMEDLFRGFSKNELALTDAMIDLLLAAAQRLEQIVTAHRLGAALPGAADLLAQLAECLPASPASVAVAPRPAVAPPSPPTGVSARPRYLAAFTPSPELDRRGVNVTAVRQRLAARGEIITATPSVRGQGLIVFEFTVAFVTAPADGVAWAADGIVLTPIAAEAKDPAGIEPGAGAGAPVPETLSLTPSHIVRVDLARLDELMRITGELVMHRSRLDDRLQQGGQADGSLREINLGLARSLREMRNALTRVRMVPIAEIFARIPFVVRDLMRESDKKARVQLEGNQTEVDKYLVERLKEPLLHLVRNAFAHGIEAPADRVAAGKRAEATITLKARSVADSVVIQVGDDGRGIDPAAILWRARAQGLKTPERPEPADLLKILCTPGFSTREEADLAAGRGVGMAVVANTLRELGGLLTLDSQPGAGTTFTLKLPLTLSIADAIIVMVAGESCAVPLAAVDEIVEVPAADAYAIKGIEVIPFRGGLLPLVRLRALFGAAPGAAATLSILVVSSERGATGLVVDRVRAQREIVIRPLADPLLRVPGISGATELGDGRPILILDPNALTQGVVRPPPATASRLVLADA